MDLKLESRDGFLLATATGQVSLAEAIKVYKKSCDAAVRRDFGKILFDFLGLTGELSDLERYELGKQGAEYCLNLSPTLKTAVIGKPPTVEMDWIKGFGSKATAK